MECIETSLPGVLLVEPDVYSDGRGFFLETFSSDKYAKNGIDAAFVQDNHSCSCYGTVRGLHYQLKNPQAKLVYVVTGEIYDVIVDIRQNSPYFGKWTGVSLSEENKRQVFVPQGFAHGFCVRSRIANVIYKCTDYYTPGDEYGVLWSDRALGIEWDVGSPVVSEKDACYSVLNEIPVLQLPVYQK